MSVPESRGLAIFTVASRSYLAHARVLMASIKEFHPEARRFVVFCDRVFPGWDPAREDFEILFAEDLPIEHFLHFAFKYTPLEFCTAVKPFACGALFEKYGFEKLIFLGADVRLYGRMDEAVRRLDHDDLLLTPQLVRALPSREAILNEQIMSRLGTYNTDFVGLRRSGGEIVSWWKRNLYEHCLNEPERGIFVDQKLMDLAPGLFDRVGILRHPGYNVMIYNLESRPLGRDAAGKATALGHPLVFFHYTGVDGCKPHSDGNRYGNDSPNIEAHGPIALSLARGYHAELVGNEFEKVRALKSEWGFFSNGIPVQAYVRKLYRETVPPAPVDPFNVAGRDSALALMAEPSPLPRLTNYAYAMHGKPDVKRRFRRIPGEDEESYARWFVHSGHVIHGVPQVIVDAQVALLDATADRRP